jgi:hypothetical protein
MNASDALFCDLRHGIQLAIWNSSGHLTIREVEELLNGAMEYFKELSKNLKTALYTGGPYCVTAKKGQKILGKVQLSCSNTEGLTVTSWCESVIDAYVRANTVVQMLEALPQWQKDAESGGGYVRKVVGILDKPGGDLLALEMMIKHVRRG